MSSLVKSAEIANMMQNDAIKGIKIPHRTSQPVLRKVGDVYVLAAFIFLFSKDNIEHGELPRPEYWITADIATGQFLGQYHCIEIDFSAQPYDRLYSIVGETPAKFTKDYYNSTMEYLDQVRLEYIKSGTMNTSMYDLYLKGVLDTIPTSYKIFYLELSQLEVNNQL